MTVAKKSAVAAKTKPRTPPKPGPAGKPAAKAVTKTAAKSVAKPAVKHIAKAAESAAKAAKPEKAKKPKLVRDSFTIPKPEYLVLDELKQRATQLARPVKKSELLRAGIKALAAMPDIGFLAAVQAVPAIKTGRPKAVAVNKPAAAA